MAALSVVAALVAGLLLDRLLETAPFVSLFLCAIMFASWYGGVGPGLFATALSISAFDYYFLPPIHSVAVALRDIPRLALFALTALFVIAMNAAQRTAAQSLRRTRDDLQTAVQQLERVNASLQVENAERRRAESALRRSEAYLAEAQRLSVTGSFGWKIASGEIFWSDETYRILMVDRAIKPTADVILQCVHPDDREFVRREIDRQAQGGQDWDYEHRLLTPDGDVKHLHVRAHRVKYESGDEEIVGALMDVTATRKAQEALHIAQTELAHVTRVTTLGEMSASIAHEVNQPLAAIVTNGEAGLRWLGRGVPEIKEAVDAIRQIVSEAHRASGVIRGIREFSRKAAPEMIQLDINDVLDDVVTLVQREVFRHGVTMRLRPGSRLPMVRGDRIQLQQVIINLVINAIQAMATITDRERVLFIRTQPHGPGQVLVAVEDVGVGIEPDKTDRLFSAFYTTKPDGLGMGLSICRSIIEAHGGRVWASRNIGPGMTFQFTISA
jgi:C4-dicarboxylate-specific signal transduction histidine kinase